MMWHQPPAQLPFATGVFPLLPWAVVPSWPMQEKKHLVTAIMVSHDA